MNCTINGIEYESRNNTGNHCDGCVASNDTILCQNLPSCGGIIWVKAKPSSEMDELLRRLVDKQRDYDMLKAKTDEEIQEYKDLLAKSINYVNALTRALDKELSKPLASTDRV